MKVLALCASRTLPLYRRVLAPFSVLSTRGHRFEFQEVVQFDPIISYGYDVTLLHQWVFSPAEVRAFQQVARERTFVYDLADPAYIRIPEVQDTLRACALVTVANDFLRKEVKFFNSRVRVLPSTIDYQFFMYGNTIAKSPVPLVGCFGPHDWDMVKEAIRQVRQRHPAVMFLGDEGAVKALGTDLVQEIEGHPEKYPGYLHHAWVGLCPSGSGDQGQDTIDVLEWGILGRPTILSSQSSAYTHVFPAHTSSAFYVKRPDDTNAWVDALELALYQPRIASAIGKRAGDLAYEQRAVKLAGQYLDTYTKMLPHVAGIV